ncbi:MAG: ABC transporter permease [Clostridia bacterium]|nr:ABC transporter permease [Clostridia bacterium]
MKNKVNIKNLIPYLGLFIVVIIFSLFTKGKVLAPRNLETIFNQSLYLIIAGIGVSFVMAQGSLDFSQGGMLGICAIVGALLSGVNPVLGVIGAMLAGLILGCISGALFSIFKIPSFIVTMCMMFILRGFTVYITHIKPISTPISMFELDNSYLKIAIFIVVLAAFYYLFNYTKLGKYCKAIGAGETAADYSGIPVKKMKIVAFAISGFLCGLAAFLTILRTGAATAQTGNLFETDVLTALVLGGMPLTGGTKSKIQSAVIGGLMLAVLGNGLLLCGIDASLQQGIKGIIFLAAVYISIDRSRQAVIK